MSSIAAVVFDLDDTLYPERQYVRSGYRAVCRTLAARPGPGERSGGEQTCERVGERTCERFEQFLWSRFCRGLTGGAFDALNSRFMLALTADELAGLVDIYRRHSPEITPFASVAETLSRLHSRYRLGLLSDGFLPAQQLKLAALGLARFFDAVVFTEQMGRDCWKPAPAGFNRMSELLGVPHDRCAYVADNPAKDFVAPNALGWMTVRYLQPGQVHAGEPAPAGGRPQVTVSLPGELHDALALWGR